MSWLVGAVPGLVAALAVVLIIRGYHMMRTSPDLGLEHGDLAFLTESERKRAASQSPFDALSGRLARRLRASLPRQATEWLQRQVDMAGRPPGLDVDTILSRCVRWLLITSPLIVMGVLRGSLVYVVLPVVVSLLLPLANVSGMARKRREQIDQDLPDFLDVLAVTVNAGMGFRKALATVADRFGGPLAEEIRTVLNQIANGASVRSAFRSMRDRTHSESVDEFVTAYLQSEELGAPLADTLNQIADDMRLAAGQRMRQKAASIEPRVSLVMTMVLIPGAIVILVGGMALALGAGDGLGIILGGG